MRVVTIVDGDLRYLEHPDPVPGDTELVVAVPGAGINLAQSSVHPGATALRTIVSLPSRDVRQRDAPQSGGDCATEHIRFASVTHRKAPAASHELCA